MAVVTRADVARLAGTSPSVISYVLNEGPRGVAPATRARVLAAVEELGYRPNAVARSLRARRTHSLGLVVPDASNPFFAELARAVEDLAVEQGYTVLLGNSTGCESREAGYVRTFLDRQVDGLILVSCGDSGATRRELRGSPTPLIAVDRDPGGSGAVAIRADNAGGAELATAHLVSHGHTAIGCLGGPVGFTTSEQRRAGWCAALAAAGLEARPELEVTSDFSREGGRTAGVRLLGRARPTAVFAVTDQQAIGLLRAAADLGLRIPGDLAVTSFDGIGESRYTVPRLTTARQPVDVLARLAVESLLRLIARPGHATPESVVVPTQLQRGSSCGCPDPSAGSPGPVPTTPKEK